MVKRYPHTAIIQSNGGSLVKGKWIPGTDTRTEIKGRYDPANNENLVRKNAQGDEKIVRAEFYTSTKPIHGAEKLIVPELGIDEVIICWWGFQTHSVIYI